MNMIDKEQITLDMSMLDLHRSIITSENTD